MPAPSIIIMVLGILLAFVFAGIAFLIGFSLFRPWLRAKLSGAPITILALIGMKLRGSNIKQILDQGIIAAHSGFPIGWQDLEWAQLQGSDIEHVTQAYLAARKRNLDYSFQELAANEKAGKIGS